MSPKGRELHKSMEYLKLVAVSTGEPTYWPTDGRKIPDVIDFFITKNINKRYLNVRSCLELSSDHSPVLTMSSKVFEKEKSCILCNKRTDWEYFRLQVKRNIKLNNIFKN